jgi:hypothetical protein
LKLDRSHINDDVRTNSVWVFPLYSGTRKYSEKICVTRFSKSADE